MAAPARSETAAVTQSKFFYGWVIVAACTLMITVGYGLMYSYSVFFKPMQAYFNWDRSMISLVMVIFASSILLSRSSVR